MVILKKNRLIILITIVPFITLFSFVFFMNSPKRPPREEEINVILIAIDTLRADHLGCYGYKKQTSPYIDKLARDSILFKRTMAQNPWTLPSFASLFTSLYPSQHLAGLTIKSLENQFVTLPEILKEHGYYTIAFTGGGYLSESFGFSQGFDSFNAFNPPIVNGVVPPETVHTDIKRVVKGAISWLLKSTEKKFFLFLHSYEPHSPYFPPSQYVYFFDGKYKGPITGDIWHDIGIIPGKLDSRFKAIPPRDLRRLISLYDAEIRYMDDQIGKLIRTLKYLNLYDKSLIIFTSDHGEEFFDHGAWEHGHSLYNELLYVPLIIKLPYSSKKGIEISTVARLIDIMPTILHVLGIKKEYPFQGQSLLNSQKNRLAFAQSYPQPNLMAVQEDNLKLIINLDNKQMELYDLQSDPAETKNILSEKRFVAHNLIRYLSRYPLASPPSDEMSPDDLKLSLSLKEKLRSLGYLR
jgi:arylsulfatase A-like enzyme